MPQLDELRFITYLSPGIPRGLFQAIVDHVGHRAGVKASLRVDTTESGPAADEDDPFSRGEADLGWVCAPSYIWLRERRPSPVELLPAAPVFSDSRNLGRPALFSEVVVRRSSRIECFRDLRGHRWVYNDPCSLSGYYSVLHKLAAMHTDARFFRELRPSGGHLRSIELVAGGQADGAAIDSNVLALLLERRPELREEIRVIESWGPFPIQPLIARSGLPPEFIDSLTRILLEMSSDPESSDVLKRYRVARFAPVSDGDYESERIALRSCPPFRPPDSVSVLD